MIESTSLERLQDEVCKVLSYSVEGHEVIVETAGGPLVYFDNELGVQWFAQAVTTYLIFDRR